MVARTGSTMKALVHNMNGGTLRLETAAKMPQRPANEYLIQVHATALTRGELTWPRPGELQECRPGVEAAGTIIETPSQSKFKKGDHVFFRTLYPRQGSAGEYTLTLDSELAVAPKRLTLNQAATVPVSGLSAWQVLTKYLGAEKSLMRVIQEGKSLGRSIFVNGASGGVGLWVTQLASRAGFEVVGTSTNEELVYSLGAREVINYKKTSITDWLTTHKERFDLVVDLVGGKSLAEAWSAAKPDGMLLTLVPPADMNWRFDLDTPAGIDPSIKGHFFLMQADGNDLAQISQLLDNGKLKTFVDSVYSLEEYEAAFDRVASGRAVGKVVLEIGR